MDEDVSHYTHKAYVLKPGIPELGEKIVAICDENVNHLRFLRGWLNCEIDVETRWSLLYGQFVVKIKLSRGSNSVSYNVKLPFKMIHTIMRTPMYSMAVCDERQRIVLYFTPLGIKDLQKFYLTKVNLEKTMKLKRIPTPAGWHLN